MFGIGSAEFIVIIIVAILVLGPEHLPKIIRTITKVTSDFRRVSTELQRAINLDSFQEPEARPSGKKTTKKTVKTKKKPSAAAASATAASSTVSENKEAEKIKSEEINVKNTDNSRIENSPAPKEDAEQTPEASCQTPEERSTV